MLRSTLALMVVIAAAACGGGDDPGGDPDARTAPPTELGGDRPVAVEGPVLEAGKTYPLLLVLHGYSASGLLQSAYLQLAPLREDPGVILIAPDGTKNRRGITFWNASDACCDFDGSGVDDVGYLGKLLDDAIASWPVDRSRVFVVGHSNGAFMAYRLACERADVVTAIAGLAGAATSIDGSGCNPSQPVHVLHMHGTADEEIQYAGGDNGAAAFPSADETVRQWSTHNGCTGTPAPSGSLDLDRRVEGAETTTEPVAGCPAGGAVELWKMQDVTHRPSFQPNFGTSVYAWLDAHRRTASAPAQP